MNGDLHICGLANLRPVHAIRYRNGSWTAFGDVLNQTGTPGNVNLVNPPGFYFTDVDCAGVDSEMHIVLITNFGHPYHAIRRESGWTGLGNVTDYAGVFGYFNNEVSMRVSAALFAGDLHVTVGYLGGQAHTMRHNSGAWTQFSNLSGTEVTHDLSSAGAQDFLHLVSNRGSVLHRIRDEFGNWSAMGDVYNAAGNNPGGPKLVTAASSLGY